MGRGIISNSLLYISSLQGLADDMSILEGLVEMAVSLLSSMGLVGLYALTVLELLFAPIPGEVVMALAGLLASRGEVALWQVIVVGTFGNLTGALAQYVLGLKVARPVLISLGRYLFFGERDLEAAEAFFRKRSGFAAVIAGRLVPGVRSVISIPAGMARMGMPVFAIATLAGSLPWNAVFAYFGYALGENWYIVKTYSGYLDALGLLALASAACYLVVKLVERSRKACASRSRSTLQEPFGKREGGI